MLAHGSSRERTTHPWCCADEWGYSDAAIRAAPERINARQLLVTAHGITNPTVGDWRANAVDEVRGDYLFDLVTLAVWRELTNVRAALAA